MSAIAEGPTPVRAPVHARSRRTTAILIHGGKLGGVQSLVGGHQGGGALPRATLAMTTTSAVAEAIRSGRVDCTARKARRILRVAKKAELNNGKLLLGIPSTQIASTQGSQRPTGFLAIMSLLGAIAHGP